MKRSSVVALILLLLLCAVVSFKTPLTASRPGDAAAPTFSLTYSNATPDGIAHLRWDIGSFTDITQTVFVLQRLREGVWQDFAFVMGFTASDGFNTFNDSIYACGDSLKYRAYAGTIGVADTIWLGISDIKTLDVEDKTTPEGVLLNAVSVDLDGHVNFIWQKASSPDAAGYVIMKQSGSLLSEFVRVEGVEITSYMDTTLNKVQALQLQFKLQVFDGCKNGSVYSLDGLFVSNADVIYNGCQDNVSVNYSSSGGFGDDLGGAPVLEPKEISLYGQRQDGTFDKITTVPYSANHNFVLSSADAVSYVAFRVETVGSGLTAAGTSTAFSYLDSFAVLPPPVPNEFYITSVSVNEGGSVSVLPALDPSIPFGSVELYRSIDNATTEKIVNWQTVPAVWIDNNADASKANYSYYGIINDTCGHKAHQSSVHTTILLTGTIAGENTFRLSWSEYEGFDVAYYRIYMQDEMIDSVEQSGSYDVAVASLEEAYGTKFFVEAVEDTTGVAAGMVSHSNTVSLITPDLPDIFLPSGFVPSGVTKIYKPIGRLANLDEYEFSVYNLSGEIIFRTTDPEVGWDGRQYLNVGKNSNIDGNNYVGSNAPPGVYICKVRIRKGENVAEHTAKITLIR